jgi:selenocysteine-specific elongation factor
VGSTVGGGVVVRPVAERARKRDVALDRARRVAERENDPHERARVEAEAASSRGLTSAEIYARANLRVDDAAIARAGLAPVAADRYVAVSVLDDVSSRVLQTLSSHHGREPASRGLERRTLKTMGDDALVDAVLARLQSQKKIEREGEIVRRAGWRPKDPDAVPHLREIDAILAKAGVTAPRPDEMATRLKADAKALEPALKRLVERGSAVRVNQDLYVHADAMNDLEKRLIAYLEARGTIDAQGFKELTGASRKWAIPLAEHFDAKKVTLRVGDSRKLRGR